MAVIGFILSVILSIMIICGEMTILVKSWSFSFLGVFVAQNNSYIPFHVSCAHLDSVLDSTDIPLSFNFLRALQLESFFLFLTSKIQTLRCIEFGNERNNNFETGCSSVLQLPRNDSCLQRCFSQGEWPLFIYRSWEPCTQFLFLETRSPRSSLSFSFFLSSSMLSMFMVG